MRLGGRHSLRPPLLSDKKGLPPLAFPDNPLNFVSAHRYIGTANYFANVMHWYMDSANYFADVLHRYMSAANYFANVMHRYTGSANYFADVLYRYTGSANYFAGVAPVHSA